LAQATRDIGESILRAAPRGVMKKERGNVCPLNQSTPLRGDEKAQHLIGFGHLVGFPLVENLEPEGEELDGVDDD
jgi:hypothetical protein